LCEQSNELCEQSNELCEQSNHHLLWQNTVVAMYATVLTDLPNI
jgi:hypothetical protein